MHPLLTVRSLLLALCCLLPSWAISQMALEGHTNEVRFVAFLPDGKTLLSGADDASIRKWDVVGAMSAGFWQQVPKFDAAPSTVVLSISMDGRLLARAGKAQGSVDVWDVVKTSAIRTIQAHQRPTYGVAISGDGSVLVSFSQDEMKVWDLASNRAVIYVKAPNQYAYRAAAISTDGRLAAISSSDKKVALFDVVTAKQIAQFEAGPGQLHALAFSPDGKLLASGSDGGPESSVKVWEITTGTLLDGVQGTPEYTKALAFSADSRFLASGGVGVRVWDMRVKKIAFSFSGHKRTVRAVAFSSDATLLASGAEDWIVGLWKLTPQ